MYLFSFFQNNLYKLRFRINLEEEKFRQRPLTESLYSYHRTGLSKGVVNHYLMMEISFSRERSFFYILGRTELRFRIKLEEEKLRQRPLTESFY